MGLDMIDPRPQVIKGFMAIFDGTMIYPATAMLLYLVIYKPQSGPIRLV
jgi:hypothetical protein